MPGMSSAITPLFGDPAEKGIELLYESPTTRVYRQGRAGQTVVFKETLGADASRRVHREADMLRRLGGIDGVVRLAQAGDRADVLALVDNRGVPLAQTLQAGPASIDAILTLAPHLARTLAEVHRAGVIHRDINPSNILIARAGEPVLIDFDLAALAEEHMAVSGHGQVVGTLAYLAPEQTGRTGRALDQRADLYGLGATLYEMATGRPPFKGEDMLQLIHDHLVREPVPPSQVDARVPEGLSRIILRLLAKSPEHRYQSAEGVLHDLLRLRGDFAQGSPGVFDLGERDFPAQLAAPDRLVGRDAELAVLEAAFAQAQETPWRTVLIEGAAGVGKSALIQQLRPMVAAAGGWFVSGKYDQYLQDGSAAGGLTQVLRALGRLLLAQAPDQLAASRRRILDRMGRSAGLMSRLSPEFSVLLQAEPDVPEIDPRQAELQMKQAVLDLFDALVSRERPLVLVLDDLQWAGAASLRTFERLMTESSLRGLLLVGGLRTEDDATANALSPMLAKWLLSEGTPVTHLKVANLNTSGMADLMAKMLRLERESAGKLAQAVGALTSGNPFDTMEMLNALRRERVLVLSEQGWRWDDAAVRRFVGRGNVVDLLAARIARLPAASRDAVEIMSCLGHSADRMLLLAATGSSADVLQESLRVPLEDGLVLEERSGEQTVLSFRHDRVRQAVLDAVDATRRERLQLATARKIATVPAFEDQAAEQYLACAGALVDRDEQRRVAGLFHAQAKKQLSTASFPLAERYLSAAETLLADANDPDDAALRDAVDASHHAALYSLGRFDEADIVFVLMQKRASDPIDLIEPACLQMRSLDARGRMEDAKQLGLDMLQHLGLQVPPKFAAEDTQRRLDEVHDWLRQDAAIDHATRKQTQGRRLLGIAKLLGRTVRSSIVRYESDALVWLLGETRRLWAEHGPCPELVASLGRMSALLIALRQDHRTAYDVARHVLTVGEALGYQPQSSEARLIFCTYSAHWFEPLEDVMRYVTQAYAGVLAGGDVSYANYVRIILVTSLLETAPTIEVSEIELEADIINCGRTGNMHAAAQHMSERQMLRALRGLTQSESSFDDANFNEREFLARMGRLPYLEHTYSECRAMFGLVMGDVSILAPNADRGLSLAGNLAGYYMTVFAHFFCAMARAWQLQGDPAPGDRERLVSELERYRQWIARRAQDQPHNFLHLLRLVEAEEAWALGDDWKAAAAYDAAAREAETRQRPWHRALITERAGLFHVSHGMVHNGRKMLADALRQYKAWGATAKVDRMLRLHDFLQPKRDPDAGPGGSPVFRGSRGSASSATVSADALDLMGVLRASQALSSETGLTSLTSRVTEVLATLSGATKVLVLSYNGDQWWLLAPAPGESPVPVSRAAERGLLPMSAFSYTDRTGEVLMVDDAATDDRFLRDPYFAGVQHCSLLVAPIASQGSVRAMLLLENTQGRAAFNAQRLDTVMLIAGQLAVSLANAQLYESLEQRVEARTRELQHTQAELVATARRAGKAEIANNVLHNVGNILNSINVSVSAVRRTIGHSRIEGLTRAVALMNEHRQDLGRFVTEDARGKALLAYLNDLVGALRAEQGETTGDLDRMARSVEHIGYIVAAQQSHAGPSSVLETTLAQELVEEALRLSTDAIERHGVHVVRRYEDIPVAALDKSRMLQVLVNLISNAAQAMDSVPQDIRVLTVSTTQSQADGGARLRIGIQDAGEGIPPNNLTRIFSHGFTTRKGGHGFGLHSSALAAMEMGGRLTVHSDGPGRGAMFVLEVPLQAPPPGG
jgi:predicted ATPase/signal transduction histidine kinase/predicted Ser/Thr protein kinase